MWCGDPVSPSSPVPAVRAEMVEKGRELMAHGGCTSEALAAAIMAETIDALAAVGSGCRGYD